MRREKMIRQAAIRYIGRDYDKAELEQLLNGSKQPHPVHEEPLIQAFIAGAKWTDKNQNIYELNLCDIPKGYTARDILEGLKDWRGHIALVEKRSPWISVKERLPEATDKFGGSEDVLILDENGWRTVAMYCISENKWNLSVGAIQGDCEYPFEITHWMPIPELPKE